MKISYIVWGMWITLILGFIVRWVFKGSEYLDILIFVTLIPTIIGFYKGVTMEENK